MRVCLSFAEGSTTSLSPHFNSDWCHLVDLFIITHNMKTGVTDQMEWVSAAGRQRMRRMRRGLRIAASEKHNHRDITSRNRSCGSCIQSVMARPVFIEVFHCSMNTAEVFDFTSARSTQLQRPLHRTYSLMNGIFKDATRWVIFLLACLLTYLLIMRLITCVFLLGARNQSHIKVLLINHSLSALLCERPMMQIV